MEQTTTVPMDMDDDRHRSEERANGVKKRSRASEDDNEDGIKRVKTEEVAQAQRLENQLEMKMDFDDISLVPDLVTQLTRKGIMRPLVYLMDCLEPDDRKQMECHLERDLHKYVLTMPKKKLDQLRTKVENVVNQQTGQQQNNSKLRRVLDVFNSWCEAKRLKLGDRDHEITATIRRVLLVEQNLKYNIRFDRQYPVGHANRGYFYRYKKRIFQIEVEIPDAMRNWIKNPYLTERQSTPRCTAFLEKLRDEECCAPWQFLAIHSLMSGGAYNTHFESFALLVLSNGTTVSVPPHYALPVWSGLDKSDIEQKNMEEWITIMECLFRGQQLPTIAGSQWNRFVDTVRFVDQTK